MNFTEGIEETETLYPETRNLTHRCVAGLARMSHTYGVSTYQGGE